LLYQFLKFAFIWKKIQKFQIYQQGKPGNLPVTGWLPYSTSSAWQSLSPQIRLGETFHFFSSISSTPSLPFLQFTTGKPKSQRHGRLWQSTEACTTNVNPRISVRIKINELIIVYYITEHCIALHFQSWNLSVFNAKLKKRVHADKSGQIRFKKKKKKWPNPVRPKAPKNPAAAAPSNQEVPPGRQALTLICKPAKQTVKAL